MTDDLQRLAAALDGTYTLGAELGGGAMARVFAATDCALGRPIVLKVLPADFDARVALARFRREVRVAAALQHPHIVPLLHAGTAAGLLYYTMPRIAGESLRTRLARDRTLDVTPGASVLHDVAAALAHAHARGVVHRDVKPGNILLADGDAFVIDFGIATALAAAANPDAGTAFPAESPADVTRPQGTDAVVVVGSAGYISPEQAAGEPVDHRTDLYALGCVAYEMFAGAPPFAGRIGRALLAAHMFESPVPLARRRPDLPADLAALITACLAKSPNDRPQHASDLLPTLARYRSSTGLTDPVRAVRTPRPQRAATRRVLAPAGIALLALAAFGTAERVPKPAGPGIALVPFRVLTRDASLTALGDGMVDLLASRIDGARRADGPTTALASGANYVIAGDVVGTGSRLTLSATLRDVATGRERRMRADGPLDSLPSVVDRLAGGLLALVAGDDPERAARVAEESPPALREYLTGRALIRRGRADEANEHFLAAVQADSTFAQAALWMAITATNTRNRMLHVDGLSLAWRHRDRLGPRDLALAEARGATFPSFGAPSAEVIRLAERAVDVAPDEPEAWRWLGAALFREGAAAEVPHADARAAAAFERVVALDSIYGAANLLRTTVYAVRGDSSAFRRALREGSAVDSASSRSGVYAWLASAVLGDTVQRARMRVRLATSPGDLFRIVSLALDLGVGLDDADTVIRGLVRSAATPEERLGALMLARQLYLARGQPSRAVRAYTDLLLVQGGVDAATMHGAGDAALDAAFGDGDPALGVRARRALDSAFARGTLPTRGGRLRAVAALYDLAHGDPRTARRVLLAAARPRPSLAQATPARESPASAGPVPEARALAAWVAVEERRPDARDLAVRLDSTLRMAPPYDLDLSNLVASIIWERLGDAPRALAAARRRTRWLMSSQYLAPSLRREARLAAATGDTAGAVDAYRHYVRLRGAAEPALRADLDAARAALAALEHRAMAR